MDYKQFFIYDAIGDIVWAASITLLGYFVGSRIPGVEKMIEPVMLAIIAITLTPTIYHALKDPKIRAKLLRSRVKSRESNVMSEQSQAKPSEEK